jgi:hypothetical protein
MSMQQVGVSSPKWRRHNGLTRMHEHGAYGISRGLDRRPVWGSVHANGNCLLAGRVSVSAPGGGAPDRDPPLRRYAYDHQRSCWYSYRPCICDGGIIDDDICQICDAEGHCDIEEIDPTIWENRFDDWSAP